MISSIFYFANTEQEYLDNFNNHQVKPYTIVFCKDTHTLWKDGIKYGGDTARTEAQISDWVETNITPLINQLQDAMDAANDAAGEEKERLDDMIGGINDQIKDEVENMLDDSEWIQENWPQGVTQWQSGWNEELESYLTTVGYWNVDPVTGEKTTWSELKQSVDSINSSVNRINTNIGTTELLLSSLKQQITDEGAARTDLENRWIQKESDTEKILKWMYSGLTTESGSDKTFADLKAAAQDGETTGISTIGAIVEKVPVIDPQTGDPQLDQDGNIVYQKDSNNNYIYRAKSTLSSALNDSLATMINESTENSATSLVITSVGDCIAALRNEVIDGRGAYASLGAKFAGMEAGLVAKADLNEAVAGLVIDGVRTVKLTVLDSLPSEASYFNTTQQLPSELDLHTKLRYTVSEFTALINTIFVHKQVAPDTWDDVPASYGADLTYDVHPGSYLKCSDDKYLYIEEISFKSSVFSEVDSKIGEAKSGLVARTDFNAASVVTMVNGAGSSVNIDANKINLNGQTTFLTAVGLSAVIQLLIADEVAAKTIDASSSYTVTDENDQSTTYTSHTIVDGNGVRVYNGENGHLYNELTDSSGTYTDTNGVIPNVMFNKSGEGWLANGNIAWNSDGEASFTGGIDATSGEISGDLNVTGSLQLGASDTNQIILGSDTFGGRLTMYDSEHQYSLCTLSTESNHPILLMISRGSIHNTDAVLTPGSLQVADEYGETSITAYLYHIEAGENKIMDIGYIDRSLPYNVTIKATNDLGESAWPNFATASTKPKGQVFAMDLATLKTMLNSSSETDLQQYAILMTPI